MGHDGGGELRWLLTYSDVVTLLLALFIFLYSISSVNKAKYNAFAESLREVFGMGKVPASYNSQSGGDGILPEATALARVRQQIMESLNEAIEKGLISVKETEEGLVLRLKDKLLFDLGSGELSPKAEPILATIAGYFQKMPNKIRIEGHTDNIPIVKGSRYASNWELSAARAASVVKFLIERCGISPSRLSLAGYAQFKPIAPNMPRIGNPENRRVEIVVISEVSDLKAPPEGEIKGGKSENVPSAPTDSSGLVRETELPPPPLIPAEETYRPRGQNQLP
jgi:chemotaxis protein MotB